MNRKNFIFTFCLKKKNDNMGFTVVFAVAVRKPCKYDNSP